MLVAIAIVHDRLGRRTDGFQKLLHLVHGGPRVTATSVVFRIDDWRAWRS
jgi:hypothetical protein